MKINGDDAIGGMAKLDTSGPVPTLMFVRSVLRGEHPYSGILIAELEGDVRFSARLPLPSECYNVPYDYADQRLAIGVSKKEGGNTNIDALMMLDPGEQIPRLAYYDDTPSLSDWYVGAGSIRFATSWCRHSQLIPTNCSQCVCAATHHRSWAPRLAGSRLGAGTRCAAPRIPIRSSSSV